MQKRKNMIYLLNCFPNVSVKHWCVFSSSFTVVMFILIFTTDLRNRHYIHFNSTYIWEFEEFSQESPRLIELIRNEFIKTTQLRNSTLNKGIGKLSERKIKPSIQLQKIFKKKRYGIYFELGANRDVGFPPSETEWLSTQLKWRGLLTQPHPDIYRGILELAGPNIHIAQVCISPAIYVKHALFKPGGDSNSSLIPVPCFPLYSLMRAYNTTYLDLLVLNRVNAPLQVLKTLPLSQVRIHTIGLVNHGVYNEDNLIEDNEVDELCCSEDTIQLLEGRGYRRNFVCPLQMYTSICYFICAKQIGYCPSKLRH